MIRSADLIRGRRLDPSYLSRWAASGFITPFPRRRNESGYPRTWPDWTPRMIALLCADPNWSGTSEQSKAARLDLLRGVASCLAEHPRVPYAVRVDGGPVRPVWTAEGVRAITSGVRLHAEIVAIPDVPLDIRPRVA